MITKNKVFLMLIIVILNLIQLVGCKNSDMSIEEFRTPEYSIEWLGEGEIKTITTTKGYKNIKIKDFNITTSENEQHAQSLNVDKSMYVPQELKLNFNFENYYLLLDELTKNDKIDQALVYTKDSNRYNSIENKEFFRIITKEGNMLYEVVSVTGDFILNSTEKRLISDKCKKLVCVNDERSLWGEDTTYKWGYLTLNGDFYYFGNAERKDLTHDIFGEKLVTSVQSKYYENELVLKNIDDIWITEMGFMYIQEGNLVVLGADTKKVISENVSGISSVDVCGWDIYTNPTVIYATESGELFGFGKNIGYVINENATSNYVYMSPQKIDTSIKVKDLYFADNFGVYVVDFNNDLYYWGYPGLKIKYNYSDKMLKEKKNFNLLISSTNPILVASDVENVSCYKNKIRSFNETTGVISTYWIKKSKTKTKGKYTIEINKQHINTGFKKYFNKYLMIKDDKFIFDPTVVKNKYVSYTKGFRASEKTIFASNWWLQYGEFEKKAFYAQTPYLVAHDVDKVVGSRFLKNGKWYIFKENGETEMFLDTTVEKLFAYDGEYFYLKDNKIYSSNKDMMYFAYKKKENSNDIMERNITGVWANEENIAFIKNGILYSYGLIEHQRWQGLTLYRADYKNKTLPPNLVKYTGLNTKQIENICFDKRNMFIIMKNGEAYKIVPEQKDNVKWYRKKCIVNDNMFMQQKDIKSIFQSKYDDYAFTNVIIKKNGKMLQWKTKKNGVEKKKKKYFTNVNDYIISRCDRARHCTHAYYLLNKNGNLYGWGRNDCGEIIETDNFYVPYAKKVLIAEDVKQISVPDSKNNSQSHGLLYLNKNGDLYFRGYNDGGFH